MHHQWVSELRELSQLQAEFLDNFWLEREMNHSRRWEKFQQCALEDFKVIILFLASFHFISDYVNFILVFMKIFRNTYLKNFNVFADFSLRSYPSYSDNS